MIRILVFGESITLGCWDSQGGWVDRLKRNAFQQTLDSEGKNKIQIFNLGVPSDTSTKILKRLESEIEARKSDKWGLRIVLCFGVNDVRLIDSKVQVDIDEFRENSREILRKAKKYTDDIIIVGTSPLAKPKVEFKGTIFVDETVKFYSEILRQIANEEDVNYIDIRQEFDKHENPQTLFCYDQIHLSDAGHLLIANKVQKDIIG